MGICGCWWRLSLDGLCGAVLFVISGLLPSGSVLGFLGVVWSRWLRRMVQLVVSLYLSDGD